MFMNNSTRSISVVLLLAAVAWPGYAAAQRAGQSMTIQTGIVVAAQAVNLQSMAGRGAAVGGVVGLAATGSGQSTSRRVRNTAIGAGTGALLTRAAEGSLDGMQFTVEIRPGTRITVITEQSGVKVGDCVNVETPSSGNANVRRVSDAACRAALDNQVDEVVLAEMTHEADMCVQAKARLLEAETDEAFEIAMRRVQFMCDD